jgi:hypothetical protein
MRVSSVHACPHHRRICRDSYSRFYLIKILSLLILFLLLQTQMVIRMQASPEKGHSSKAMKIAAEKLVKCGQMVIRTQLSFISVTL